MGLRWIKKGHRVWRDGLRIARNRPSELLTAYNAGWAGTWYDPEAREELWDFVRGRHGEVSGEDALTSAGLAGSGAGKLSLSFLAAAYLFPGCYPGAAQERGDCVVHGGKDASRTTIANEILAGQPDEISGRLEGVPEVPAQGIREGVLSSEWLWWLRMRGGDGWDCSTCAKRILSDGVMLKKPYPELGIDLTDYTYANTARYARSGPTDAMRAEGRKHLIRTAAESSSMEATRDFIHNGVGIFDCGSQGWSSKRDANGVSSRQGSWSHSMKNDGFDDRQIVRDLYGGPLLLIVNNWGEWNSGPRDIIDSAKYVPTALRKRWEEVDLVNPTTGNIMIPRGSYWTRWSDANNRYRIALSGANGWVAEANPFLAI